MSTSLKGSIGCSKDKTEAQTFIIHLRKGASPQEA